mgnify:CR=1 FL=1
MNPAILADSFLGVSRAPLVLLAIALSRNQEARPTCQPWKLVDDDDPVPLRNLAIMTSMASLSLLPSSLGPTEAR